MIQFKRGTTENWKKLKKPLADGQPGYDKVKHKIKVGNGKDLWDKLPYASILKEEVLDSEINARNRVAADPESLAIMTYGTDAPDSRTVGELYLQCYDAEPEVDYVVEYGVNDIWTYQKWRSGIARCWGTLKISTAVSSKIDESQLYNSTTATERVRYPFTFKNTPSENASLHSPSGMVWLSSKAKNNTSSSAIYYIISPDKLDTATYDLTLDIQGFYK